MQTLCQYILVLGSNLQKPINNIQLAITMLQEKCNIVKKTQIIKTTPLLYKQQPVFFNQGLLVDCPLSSIELLDFCQSIEKKIGREKYIQYGARKIDIDIVWTLEKKNMYPLIYKFLMFIINVEVGLGSLLQSLHLMHKMLVQEYITRT